MVRVGGGEGMGGSVGCAGVGLHADSSCQIVQPHTLRLVIEYRD